MPYPTPPPAAGHQGLGRVDRDAGSAPRQLPLPGGVAGAAPAPVPGVVIAPGRLAVLRAALMIASVAVVGVEAASALHVLDRPAITAGWLGAALAAAAWWTLGHPEGRRAPAVGVGGARPAVSGLVHGLDRRWLALPRLERILAGGLVVLVTAELVLALASAPNNFDSQTYHLPKVEHWVAQGSVGFFPTAIHRQVSLAPGAEYLLLNLRLLTGGDRAYNLVQWAAGVLCLLLATRITAQLGGGRRAQLLTAFVLGSTPMVVLQASSTQTDLVAAAWCAGVATLALDGLRRRADRSAVLALGAATGLAVLTKSTGLLGAAPMLLLWGVGQLRLAILAAGSAGHSPGRPGPVDTAATGGASGAVGGHGPKEAEAPAEAAGPASGGAGPAEAAGAGGPAVAGAWAAGSHPAGGRRRLLLAGLGRLAGATLVVLALAALITGPFLARVTAEFGNPLGPPQLRRSVPMQRHDPAAIVVNALRIGHTATDTPIAPLRAATARAIESVADRLGVDPQDPDITFGGTRFPVQAWYPDEDRAAFPLTGVLALIAVALALVRPSRLGSPGAAAVPALRGYAAATVLSGLLFVSTVKWQPWGNRLLLFAVVLATPLVGCWLDAVADRAARRRVRARAGATSQEGPARGRRPARGPAMAAVAVLLCTAGLAGVLSVAYGYPRRLVGTDSVFSLDRWDQRFVRRPGWAPEFRWAAAGVRASGARRVGLVQENDTWEYPWWLLLGDRQIVALQSVLPHHPAPDPDTMDAIVCTGREAVCRRLVPPGWVLAYHGYVGYALPQAG